MKKLQQPEGKEKIRKVRELTELAGGLPYFTPFSPPDLIIVGAELDATPGALAIAWVAKNPNTSTVILGASTPQQVLDNLRALELLPKLTPAIMDRIERILNNKPRPEVCRFLRVFARHLLMFLRTSFPEEGHA